MSIAHDVMGGWLVRLCGLDLCVCGNSLGGCVPTISSSSILPEHTSRSESGVPIADHMVVARTSKGARGGEGWGVRDTGCVRVEGAVVCEAFLCSARIAKFEKSPKRNHFQRRGKRPTFFV